MRVIIFSITTLKHGLVLVGSFVVFLPPALINKGRGNYYICLLSTIQNVNSAFFIIASIVKHQASYKLRQQVLVDQNNVGSYCGWFLIFILF